MSIPFPSLEFFTRLKQSLADDPAEDAAASDAYFGLIVDDGIFVVELDGHQCSAVAQGGNLLDLDFGLAAPAETWRAVLRSIQANDGGHRLETLLADGQLELQGENEDGAELARGALPMIQALLDRAKGLDLDLT